MEFMQLQFWFLLGLSMTYSNENIFGDSCFGRLLVQNAEFQTCFAGLAPLIGNIFSMPGNQTSDQNSTESGNGLLQVLCRDDVKQSYNCLLRFMQQCPEQQADMLSAGNLDEIIAMAGMDMVCSISNGDCVGVQTCFPNITDLFDDSETVTVPPSTDVIPPVTFLDLVPSLCGQLKVKYECASSQFSSCMPADRQSSVPVFLNRALASTAGPQMLLMDADLVSFITQECPIETELLEMEPCIREKLTHRNYTRCYDSAVYDYKQEGTDNCQLMAGLTECSDDHVRPDCGTDASEFLVRNIPFYMKDVSKGCVTSGAVGKVNNDSVTAVLLCFVTAFRSLISMKNSFKI